MQGDHGPTASKTAQTNLGLVLVTGLLAASTLSAGGSGVDGKFFRGEGDTEYLQLLDTAGRMLVPDPEFQNLSMLYMASWNGLVEGPTWDAWWVQNSYGTTYAVLPFLQEPFVTFLQNSQDLWFDQMGDGKRVGASPPFDWVAPDGCLCDAARPGWIVYRQGDGRPHMHDWGMEFTAAGLLMQSELLLIGRDQTAVAKYLPKLERCANFIETRRDPARNLFLAGPAGNLLAPSFAGWKRPDGTYGQAYLTGLSVTYIAALDRLIEVEKLAGRNEQAAQWARRRETARSGLAQLITEEGYFINSLDPDGTRHGVVGAAKHSYFETSPNQDAIAFRVVDDRQAGRIYDKIASIPGLRPRDFILPNYPSYDDMYERPEGLWAFGTWVNGGHWSTCEARMMLGYYRLGKFEDARRSMRQLLTFAKRFRMDNPLVKFGSDVYQPGQPINLTYDAFGPPAAFIRGLFEYLYRADTLTVMPHIPPTITRLEQRLPVRFGDKLLYLAVVGAGPISSVKVNGKAWAFFDATAVQIPYSKLPKQAAMEIALGGSSLRGFQAPAVDLAVPPTPPHDDVWLRLKRANLAVNSLPLRIGADSDGGSRFKGEIAQALVFRRALNEQEIAVLARGETAQFKRDPALVGDWSFEQTEGDAFVSSPAPRLRAKSVGHIEVADSAVGKAVRLDGTGYLEIAASPELDLTEACTLAVWVCPKELPPGGGRIIDKSQAGTSNGFLLDTHPGNSLRLIANIGSLGHPAKLAPGVWTHVAATVAPDGRLALYAGGKRVAQRDGAPMADVGSLLASAERSRRFLQRLAKEGLADGYEAAHARLIVDSLSTAHARLTLLAQGRLKPLESAVSQGAADQLYVDTARKLAEGLSRLMASYEASGEAKRQQIARWWKDAAADGR
jgi:hypothetical protein